MAPLFITSLLVLASLLTFPSSSEAHELRTAGSVGVILHTDPDDDPIIGQTTSFFFDVTDRDSKFTQSQCTCKMEITEGGRSIFETVLTPVSGVTYGGSFVFPNRSVYTIIFKAIPRDTSFQSFSVTYPLRVSLLAEPTSATESTSIDSWLRAHWYYPVGGTMVLLLGLGGLLLRRSRKRTDS